MPRLTTFRQKADRIKRKFKRVSDERFFYNTARDLKGKYSRIACWFIIHDETRGRSIFPIEFKRKMLLSVPEWKAFFTKGRQDYRPIYEILTQSILPAINNKSGSRWRFVALLGWTGTDDLRSGKDSPSHNKRNNAAKKRNANARNPDRRRHRNKKR